jgi:hypothetical protein
MVTWKYTAILYSGLHYSQILVSMEVPGTNPPQILRNNYTMILTILMFHLKFFIIDCSNTLVFAP